MLKRIAYRVVDGCTVLVAPAVQFVFDVGEKFGLCCGYMESWDGIVYPLIAERQEDGTLYLQYRRFMIQLNVYSPPQRLSRWRCILNARKTHRGCITQAPVLAAVE